MSSTVYRDIEKPSSLLLEVEGRCPLCRTVMRKSKSASYDGQLYSFDFPIYICISHHHGYFRWLGGKRGHVRVLFPQILKYGKVVNESKHDDRPELMAITCEDCGFVWEELKIRPRDETYCPECGRRIDLSIKE